MVVGGGGGGGGLEGRGECSLTVRVVFLFVGCLVCLFVWVFGCPNIPFDVSIGRGKYAMRVLSYDKY